MITVYTSPTCMKCKLVKKMLTDRNIPFEESDNYDELIDKNICSLPVVVFDGEYELFDGAVKRIQDMKG